ncbi:MAG: hypothetical protein EA397_11635 [Deltaproteobacteria bacterium]|nr:MAG: hypothetical protein EA397_11635 [Deltaproteobacteria bacterium]
MRSILLLGLSVACSSVSGELRIDGQLAPLRRCTTLEVVGFAGVDLHLENGRVIRLFREGDRIDDVGFFDDPAEDVGALLGPCATGSIEDGASAIQDVRLLRGEASFSCEAVFEIEGDVRYQSCGPGPGYRRP